jgi:hypothetical protein
MSTPRHPRRGALLAALSTITLLGVVATTPAKAAAAPDPDSGFTNAAGQERSLISSLRGPVVLDGKRYSPQQMKRFEGRHLLFVLGSREAGNGAVAAFHTKPELKRYLRRTHRAPAAASTTRAHASWDANVSVFYPFRFLEGPSISVTHNSGIGDLRSSCLLCHDPSYCPPPYYNVGACYMTWDNAINSAKTGSTGAYLYNRPFLDTTDGYVYLPPADSVEVWRFFSNMASSIWVP